MKPPTEEFLEELRERARYVGWSVDYIEVEAFLRDLYMQAGIAVPDLEPYPICDKCDQRMPQCTCEPAVNK